MSLEEILLHLFDKTLDSATNDNLETILTSQAKIIAKKKENSILDVTLQKSSIQKKLDVLEKNILNKDSILSKRRSKVDIRSNTGSYHENEHSQQLISINNDDQSDLTILKRQNKQLQTLIASIQFKQRENYLQNCNRFKQIQNEREELIEKNKSLNEKQQTLNQRAQTLKSKQMNLEQQEKQIQYQKLSLQENEQEQFNNDEFLNQRRENMEGLQRILTGYVSQLLNFANQKDQVQNQLDIQIDAIEALIQYILQERSMLQSEQLYLRKLKQSVMQEKKEILQLKDQIK